MKFERTRDKEDPSLDSACYRKFLAGNKTLYAKAFWENGPRNGSVQRVKEALSRTDKQPTSPDSN